MDFVNFELQYLGKEAEMQFSDLIRETPVLSVTRGDPPVTSLSLDSRKAGPGTLFFCIPGVHIDRHAFAADVYAAGGRAFIAERPLSLPSDAAVALVPNARLALADLSCAFYGHPERKIFCIGVTGTKGKTTTAFLLTCLLQKQGVNAGYIGSLGAYCCGRWVATENTTPESLELVRLMAEMRECGVTHLAMEVSSQSLSVGRIRGLRFPLCLMTGLGYDHVGPGEHENLSAYFAAKKELFLHYHCETILYNADDRLCRQLLCGLPYRKIPVGFSGNAVFSAHSPELWQSGSCLFQNFDLIYRKEAVPVSLALPGEFNIRNALLAVAAVIVLSEAGRLPAYSLSDLARTLESAQVPGHLQCVPLFPDRIFLIDYAHNGQSMAALLSLLRQYRPSRLTVLFGAVGERSQCRRQSLGLCVSQYADRAILTADNPGREDPRCIAEEIRTSMGKLPSVVIPDREEAIRYAVETSIPGEIVALCGKGAERTQVTARGVKPFCEEAILRSAVNARKKSHSTRNFFCKPY